MGILTTIAAAISDATSAGRAMLTAATVAAQRTLLGLGTADSPEFTAVNIGHASDTTIARSAAGVATLEGNRILTSDYQYSGKFLGCSNVDTNESTASSSPIGLTTAQTVSFTLNQTSNLLVTAMSEAYNSAAGNNMTIYVNDGTTDHIVRRVTAPGVNYQASMAGQLRLTGVTSGSKTFTMKFATTAGTANFLRRSFTVQLES